MHGAGSSGGGLEYAGLCFADAVRLETCVSFERGQDDAA
jgi:hypothetical protein